MAVNSAVDVTGTVNDMRGGEDMCRVKEESRPCPVPVARLHIDANRCLFRVGEDGVKATRSRSCLLRSTPITRRTDTAASTNHHRSPQYASGDNHCQGDGRSSESSTRAQ